MIQYILLVAILVSTASAQNCTADDVRTNCFKCLSTEGCFFCSTLGCRDNNNVEQQQCTSLEGSVETTLANCPDPCVNPDSSGCTDCLSPQCGFCFATSSCMTGSASGPTYKNCSSMWRYNALPSNLTTTQACSPYQTCTALTNCTSCVMAAQDAYTPCSWASNMTCIAGSDGGVVSCPAPETPPAEPDASPEAGSTPDMTTNNPPTTSITQQSSARSALTGFVSFVASGIAAIVVL